MLIELNVVTRLQDNGDGGYTMYIYNNEEEMLADHPLGETFNRKTLEFGRRELTEEEKDDILSEYDPYKNGYLGTDKIAIEFNPDTKEVRLAEPLSFHGGQ